MTILWGRNEVWSWRKNFFGVSCGWGFVISLEVLEYEE